MPADSRRSRARLAATVRHHSDDVAAVTAARQEHKATAAERYIRRLVDEAPPLTAEQRDRLALLLRPKILAS